MNKTNTAIADKSALVSIIMPAYNTGRYIEESVKSVLEQTYSNFELIIVDDGSTDNTLKILDTIYDERIVLLQNDKNYGAAYCRNRALRKAKGKWIAFLDSDDIWLPNKLEKQIAFMLNNDFHFSYTNYEQIDEFGKRKNVIVTGPKIISINDMFNYNWLGCLTVMYDAEFIGLVQIEQVKRFNDYAMWLQVVKKCDCYLFDETLALYRKGRSGSLSNKGYLTLIKDHYGMFRRAEHFGVIRSFNFTLRNMLSGIYKKLVYETHK